MKFILFTFFCALIAVSLARPQQTYEKNGPAKLYKGDGDDDGYGTGDGHGGLKLDGDDGSYDNGDPIAVTAVFRLGDDGDDGSHDNGEPLAVTGQPRKLYRSAGDDKSDNGEPIAATGGPDGDKEGDDGDDKSDKGKPLRQTGAPPKYYEADGGDGDQSDNGEPIAVTGSPQHVRTVHKVGNAYKVSSAVAQRHRHGKSVAHVSQNGPHKLIARK